MIRSALTALVLISLVLVGSERATAQTAVLAEMYGRGVHAYYSGNHSDAYKYLSMAIDNGIKDPRAYYFRGIVADASGRPEEAHADWQRGAELEAAGKMGPGIGRSLARFQGSSRLKLEEIRQQARLQALATAAARSQQRYGEIEAAEANVLRSAPVAKAAPAPPTTPPPVPPAAENPFADEMAAGEPKVQSDDALADAMNDPFADDTAAAAGAAPAAAGDANPFGGDAGAAADPFGAPAAGAADPFGGAADPFGGGAAGGAMEDPFGGAAGDPFGN